MTNDLPARTLLLAATVLLVSTLTTATRAWQDPVPVPALDGNADARAVVVKQMCNECHDTSRILAMRRTSQEWETVIRNMIEKGAAGTAKEFETVFAYLLANRGKVFVNAAGADELSRVLGLSPKDAELIVSYRTASGPFADLGALKKVPGIDPSLIDACGEAVVF